MLFRSGAGVGGHCIPIDPLYLLDRSRQFGIDLPFIESADKTNRSMPKYVAERLIKLAKPQAGATIAILGVAYKSGISDTRESPATDVADYLVNKGYRVVWSDPHVECFGGLEELNSGEVPGAVIVVTAQPGLDLSHFLESRIPILDCTGK